MLTFKQLVEEHEYKPVVEYDNSVTATPIVSVVVQTYNHEDYIEKCLNSILKQETNFKYEICLGEDCSTDRTREICISLAENYRNKIRLFLHDEENKIFINGNMTGRFNYIYNLYSARGKYIAICDGDDYWVDDKKLQKQFDALEKDSNYNLTTHPSVKVMAHTENEIGIAGNFGNEQSILSADMIIKSNASACPSQAIFFRKSVINSIREYFINAPGVHMHIQNLASIPNGAIYLPDKMAHYRVASKSSVIKNIKKKKSGLFNWLNSNNVVLKHFRSDYPEFSDSFNIAINKSVFAIIKSRQTSLMDKLKGLRSAKYPEFIKLFFNKVSKKIFK